ncbi:MAG: beta-galactosidase [Solirubrobacteraceae bacterium]|nr:beta-galactosidase [Solirubrobacteraceae bacterium]
MIRRAKLIALAVAFAVAFGDGLTATAGTVAAAVGPLAPPAPISLSHGWQFLPDPHDSGLAGGWQGGRTGRGWRSVTVPHVFDGRPLPALFGGTVGWYRLHFRTPSTPDGFAWAIRFEQSRRFTRVWLNGRSIGGHDDPYTPFQLDLGALRPGAENTLVVRVDNRKGVEPREGWWNWGGLVRPVSLVPLGPVTVSDLGIMPDLACPTAGVCTGRVIVDAVVANRSPRTVTPTLELSLTAPGASAASAQTSLLAPGTMRPGERANLRFSVPLDGPVQTWSPDRPSLYAARLETRDGSDLAQVDQLAVGMRKVENRGGLLYLNGRQIQLRGASIEEDAPGRGPALTPADQDRVVEELKALHADVTRAQYPLSEGLLERLDRAGILVWTQAPIYNRDDLLHTAAQRAYALSTLRGSVLATRNHPSVLTESVANELTPTPDTTPGTKAYIDQAVRLVRGLDPPVPVSIDVLSYPNYPAEKTYEQFDLLGVSNYYGWYTGKPGHLTSNKDGIAPFMRLAHARYPRQALVMSEFGAESSIQGPADEKQTFAFQTRYVQETLATVATLPFLSGAIYWTLREFAVKPRWNGGPPRPSIPRTSIHHKGLITYDGQPKPAFGVTAQLFAQTPLYRTPEMPIASPGPSSGGPPRGGDTLAWLVALGLCGLTAAGVAVSARGRRRAQSGKAGLLPRVD